MFVAIYGYESFASHCSGLLTSLIPINYFSTPYKMKIHFELRFNLFIFLLLPTD